MANWIFICFLCFSLTAIKSCSVAEDAGHSFDRDAAVRRASMTVEAKTSMNATREEYRYYNKMTAPYLIESLPLVSFDTGEMYSGSVPIDVSVPERTLFFVFKPAIDSSVDEVTIWLNGGPGCSSLAGFFQGNGPILWQPGTYKPQQNPYSWATVTNMLWVDQPVGAGFTRGDVRARNERDIAQDFVGFFKNWQNIFGIENYKVYMSGESYAGRYVPYISAEMLNQKDDQYYNLKGALIYSPTIGAFHVAGQDAVTYPFIEANNHILNLDPTHVERLRKKHESCAYADYLNKYLRFPPPSHQPPLPAVPKQGCDTFNMYNEAVTAVNPCFNAYHITDNCPLLGDPIIGLEGLGCLSDKSYFNRADVKDAIHAPNVFFSECGLRDVFLGPFASDGVGKGPEGEDDLSLDPIQRVLPRVIEATNRVLISHGEWDGYLLTNGTLLAIQNMTWNGRTGFDEKPSQDFISTAPDVKYGTMRSQGVMGKFHVERGLAWVETYQAGHQQPQYQPRVALKHLQWLLGHIDEL